MAAKATRKGQTMSAKRMNWQAVSEALGIRTETCTVYRAPRKKHGEHKRRLTKQTAIKDTLTAIAEDMLAPCECERGDREAPSYYCGCTHRTLEIVEVLTDVVRRLPESMDEWKLKTTWEYWEDHKWKEHD